MESRDAIGNTMLHYAVIHNSVELVQAFVEKGISVNEKYRNGATVLHFAAEKGHRTIIYYLLHCGADPNLQGNFYNISFFFFSPQTDDVGWTPLFYAIRSTSSRPNPAVDEFIIEMIRGVASFRTRGHTSAHVQPNINLHTSTEKTPRETTQNPEGDKLKHSGTDFGTQQTLPHITAKPFLLEGQLQLPTVDLYKTDRDGCDLLSIAARYDQREVIDLLLDL